MSKYAGNTSTEAEYKALQAEFNEIMEAQEAEDRALKVAQNAEMDRDALRSEWSMLDMEQVEAMSLQDLYRFLNGLFLSPEDHQGAAELAAQGNAKASRACNFYREIFGLIRAREWDQKAEERERSQKHKADWFESESGEIWF